MKSGKTQRRADYAFYTAPNYRDPKFFVEAKKPSLDLSGPDHYYQAIRYGWNKKIPISLLTDFEEFHILDCRYMPDIATIMNRKIEYIHYEQYAEEETFARIFHLFGREAVANGSIEKFAATLPKPKGKAVQKSLFRTGYQPIDEAFLEKLDEYRLTLAKSFKKNNQHLESEELTEAVQRTIDRLVFIRFLEDKSIEESRVEHFGSERSAWKAFSLLCRALEPKYNGLVFKEHPVIDGKDFIPPDDKEFVDICDDLAHDKSPYLFDEIPISILGSIYERFLGKVVHATPKRADVEEKPEVRKAGGVYYTPEYIVRYIVSNTVGKLIEGKTPEEIAPMAFADIACGSGSFLIEVYSELLDYHERRYNTNPGKAKPADVQNRDGRLALSLKKRQDILTNNIYGVDIDFQATEVTQLSLYLKLLEDVTMNDAYQFSLIKEKILPDLRNNIICGNSLIGTDILEGDLFDRTEEHKLNPMNFEDAFPKIMKRGGFDAIVGNPPYGSIFDDIEKKYIVDNYETYRYKYDSYIYFIEKAISLTSSNGFVCYITPELWLRLENCEPLRRYIFHNSNLFVIKVCGEHVFTQAVVSTIISIIKKSKQENVIRIEDDSDEWTIEFSNINESNNYVIDYRLKTNIQQLVNKIKEKFSTKLSNIGDMIQGITPYDRYAGQDAETIKKRAYHFETKKDKYCEKWLDGKDVTRYSLGWSGEWLRYGKWLAAPRDPRFFQGNRILFREVPGPYKRIQATIAYETLYHGHSITPFKLNDGSLYDNKYILGIVNSKLISWYGGLILPNFGKDIFPKLNPQDIKALPLRTIDFTAPADKSRHDHIVTLVEKMLSSKEQLSHAKTDAERTRLEMLCTALDRQIDTAVYELYGLTEEEIKVVEGEK